MVHFAPADDRTVRAHHDRPRAPERPWPSRSRVWSSRTRQHALLALDPSRPARTDAIRNTRSHCCPVHRHTAAAPPACMCRTAQPHAAGAFARPIGLLPLRRLGTSGAVVVALPAATLLPAPLPRSSDDIPGAEQEQLGAAARGSAQAVHARARGHGEGAKAADPAAQLTCGLSAAQAAALRPNTVASRSPLQLQRLSPDTIPESIQK